MVSLFNDPKQLIREDKILDFWPTKNQMSAERINSTARFIVYATCIVYIGKGENGNRQVENSWCDKLPVTSTS